MYRVYLWLVVVGMLLIALAACGSGDDAEQVVLQAPPTSPPSTATAVPTVTPTPDPQGLPQDGALLIVRGASVYLYAFPRPEGNRPLLVAENIDTDYLRLAPDRDAIVYGAPANDRYTGVYLTDLSTRETIQLADLQESFASYWYGNWSPDHQWVLLGLSTRGLALVRRDGTGYQHIADATNFVTHWLADGRLLLVDSTYETSGAGIGTTVYHDITILDPATGARAPVEIDIDALNADPEQFEVLVEAEGLAIVPPAGFKAVEEQRPVITGPNGEVYPAPGAPCDTWHIALIDDTDDQPQQETLHTAHDVYRLSNLTPLADGSMLVLEWTIPDCKIVNPPVVQLQHYLPGDAEPVTLAAQVFTGVGLAQASAPYREETYIALSPDERFVAWVGGSVAEQFTAVYVTDLERGTTTELLRENLARVPGSDYIGDQFYSKLYWIAPGE